MANVTLKKTPNFISILPRHFATAATSAKHQSKSSPTKQLAKESVKVTKLDNGVLVASLENYSPVTRIAAIINSGPRDELNNQRGAFHALRIYSSLATRNYSAFGLSRTLNQLGAELSITSTKENTKYLLESTRKNISRGVDILGEILSRPELRHWEIDDARLRLEFDLDVYAEKPELQLFDLIHQASFKNGLSNSLYAPRYNVENLDSELLQDIRRRTFTSNRLSLVGTGISHEDLIKSAELFRLPVGPASDFSREPSKFLPIEIRNESSSELVHLAIATEGTNEKSKDALTLALISHAFGIGSQRIKYSTSSKLSRALLTSASYPTSVSSFNVSYSDTGLFGFHVIGNKSDIPKLVRGVITELNNAAKNGLSNNELTAARNSLKLSLIDAADSSSGLIDNIYLNHENASSSTNPTEIIKAIDSLSANDINAAIKRLASNKLSLAAIGDLSELPRLSELL